jgi:hypothetical protein
MIWVDHSPCNRSIERGWFADESSGGESWRPESHRSPGRIVYGHTFLAVNCQATISQSLRDKDIGTQSTRPPPIRLLAHSSTRRHAETVPVTVNVDPSSGMKVRCTKTCFSATGKVLNKNFSSRNSRKTGLARAQKIAWHNGCLRGFTSSD